MNKNNLDTISKKAGNSFFLYQKSEVENIFKQLKDSVSDRGEIAFSVKSNYCPSIIKDLDHLDSWFEVSSREEYHYVKHLNIKPKKIIVNTPVCDSLFLKECFDDGSIFNIQNKQQWIDFRHLAVQNTDQIFEVGLRLNLGYSSRFGLSDSAFDQILIDLKSLGNVCVVALHVHSCEGHRSLESFERKFDALHRRSENVFFGKPLYLNIGGGFFSLMPTFLKDQFQEEIPSLSQYLLLLNHLSRKSNCKLLVEPGALLVSTSMRFFTKVVSIDTLSTNTYIQVDGSIYDIQPTKSNKQLPFNVISEGEKAITGRVVGFTGMEDDILVNELSNKLSLGDWLEFSNVGAYSQTLRPSFISSPKPIVSFENNTLKLIRKKASHQDLFSQWL